MKAKTILGCGTAIIAEDSLTGTQNMRIAINMKKNLTNP